MTRGSEAKLRPHFILDTQEINGDARSALGAVADSIGSSGPEGRAFWLASFGEPLQKFKAFRTFIKTTVMEAQLRYHRDFGSAIFPNPAGKLTGPKLLAHKATTARNKENFENMEQIDPELAVSPRINFMQRNIEEARIARSRQKRREARSRKEILLNTKHEPGSIPNYVAVYREEMFIKKNTPKEARCPPGMRLMSEQEKSESIANLNAQKEEIEQILSRAPLIIERQKMVREHRELEQQLKDIEQSRDRLTRKYVFVPE
jgi:hypothetical protein